MATYTTYDWIEIDTIPNGGVGGGFSETYVLAGGPPADGEILGTFDSVDVTSTDANFGEGDTVDLGGTSYTVINHGYIQTHTTFLNGTMQTVSARIVEIEDGGGNVRTFFIPQDGEGDLTKIVSIEAYSANYSLTSLDVTQIDNDNNVHVVCYARGTSIRTPRGNRPAESLRPGDLVTTVDHGTQAIRWIRQNTHALEEASTVAMPVLVSAGALGRNLPCHDLVVSPQHRILVGGSGQLSNVFPEEAFAPAKALTALPGIRYMRGKHKITWIHFACDRHEVVVANGCLSESLLLGRMVVNGMTAAQQREVTIIFGVASGPGAALNGPPARKCLSATAAQLQIAKYSGNGRREFAGFVPKQGKEPGMVQCESMWDAR